MCLIRRRKKKEEIYNLVITSKVGVVSSQVGVDDKVNKAVNKALSESKEISESIQCIVYFLLLYLVKQQEKERYSLVPINIVYKMLQTGSE